MRRIFIAVIAVAAAATGARAQTPAEDLAAGNREYRAMRAESALAHYERVLASDPDNFEALWKASRSAMDIAGSSSPAANGRAGLSGAGERYARRAVKLRPGDAEGYFALARALGISSRSLGVRERVRHATVIRQNAAECIRLRPGHSGCHHIMGVWNAEVMRLSAIERVVARNFLGGRALGQASWPDAQRYLEHAVALAPDRIVHHLELADVYRDRRNFTAARREYETAMRLAISDYNDQRYKKQAEASLRALP